MQAVNGGGRTKQTFYTSEGDILTAYKFKELAKIKQQLAIAVKFIDAYSRYVPKVKTPKDFNIYEAVWFLFRTEAEPTD